MAVCRDQAGDFHLTDEPGPAPDTFYACAAHGCAQECTYPADMLRWWDGETVNTFDADDQPSSGKLNRHGTPGWYCDSCIEHWDAITGPTLARHLAAAQSP